MADVGRVCRAQAGYGGPSLLIGCPFAEDSGRKKPLGREAAPCLRSDGIISLLIISGLHRVKRVRHQLSAGGPPAPDRLLGPRPGKRRTHVRA